MITIHIKAEEVMEDVRSAAWLEGELHPEQDRHRRHEMADICEKGNVERVWRVLGMAVAEIRLTLSKLLSTQDIISTVNGLECPESWSFRIDGIVTILSAAYIKEKIHEYLVAAVMADRTAVIIPTATEVWQERADAALASLHKVAATSRMAGTPAHRPLWPL